MKTQYLGLTNTLLFCFFLMLISCKETEQAQPKKGTSSNYNGSWKQGDGLNNYIKFDGSAAISCSNGVATNGVFNASIPSMTFIINGDKTVFPLQFNKDNSMLMGMPDQAITPQNSKLYYRSSTFPCEAIGRGTATFWIQSDLKCGSIYVTVNGENDSISNFYSRGTPNCLDSGCANFIISPGTYTFSANCNSYKWGGNVTVKEDECETIELK